MLDQSSSLASSELLPQDIINDIGHQARLASIALLSVSDDVIHAVLLDIADSLVQKTDLILSANKKDVDAAIEKGLSPALVDRLRLEVGRVSAIADGVRAIADLENPVGRILWENNRPNGLKIQRVAVPIGVLGMIYESRPNVTVDAAALCLKSRNAVILRGGSESFESSSALHGIIQEVLRQHDLMPQAVSMVPGTDRAFVGAMLKAQGIIDVMVPRGGASLTGRVMAEATMPVFAHLDGICHIYVHEDSDLDMARDVIVNAKMRRTGICGAAETLLFDHNLSNEFAYNIVSALVDHGCVIVGDERAKGLRDDIGLATEVDWTSEYLAPKISVKFVNGVDEAAMHINQYGSHHTDSIITNDKSVAEQFMIMVDSGIVMHNTSTQFADGGEFGMGAEIGIATGKMHARGPVGLEQLCTYKYRVFGHGQTRP